MSLNIRPWSLPSLNYTQNALKIDNQALILS